MCPYTYVKRSYEACVALLFELPLSGGGEVVVPVSYKILSLPKGEKFVYIVMNLSIHVCLCTGGTKFCTTKDLALSSSKAIPRYTYTCFLPRFLANHFSAVLRSTPKCMQGRSREVAQICAYM